MNKNFKKPLRLHGVYPCKIHKTHHSQYRKSSDIGKVKQTYCVSGIYPNDIRDDLVNSNRCMEDDNSVKIVNKSTIVRAKINYCIGNVL